VSNDASVFIKADEHFAFINASAPPKVVIKASAPHKAVIKASLRGTAGTDGVIKASTPLKVVIKASAPHKAVIKTGVRGRAGTDGIIGGSESQALLALYADALTAGYTGSLEVWLSGKLNNAVAVAAGDAGKFLTNNGTTTSWDVVSAATVGLGEVDNTSDINKPVSTAAAAGLTNKLNIADFDSTLDTALDNPALIVDQGSLTS
jgi:hypothetical protein